MSIHIQTLNALVPVSKFSKGQATQVFDRLKTESQLVVIKNNTPAAILLSPAEFARLTAIEAEHRLLLEAQERLARTDLNTTLSEAEMIHRLGLTSQAVDDADEAEIG